MERSKSKKYTGGGAILVLKNNGKEYVALVKRSDDARHNPRRHSAFFGLADKEDANNPIRTCSRELNEEILIVDRAGNNTYALLLPGVDFREAAKVTKESVALWGKEKGITLPGRIEPLRVKILKRLDYIEDIGRIKSFVVQAEIKSSLDKLVFFDGETKHEHPRRGLLDRRIDLLELRLFKRWWLESPMGSSIKAAASFRGGKRIKPCRLIKTCSTLSPGFMIALNAWWLLSPK